MKVRAKFTVTELNTRWSGREAVAHVKLAPMYDPSIPEDRRFSRLTPSGEMSMTVLNPAVIEAMKPGTEYYVEFTPVLDDATPIPAEAAA